jgi:hypothetical protein
MDWITFWDDPSFWPSFWAELIVGVGIALFLTWLITKLRAPKPGGRLLVLQTEYTDGSRRYEFSVQNTGDLAFRAKEVRWELFVPYDQALSYNFAPFSPVTTTVESEGRLKSGGQLYCAYAGLVQVPLFQGVNVKLFYWQLPAAAPPLQGKMHYVLSTTYGQVPAKAKRTHYGRVDLKTAGVVGGLNVLAVANVTLEPLASKATGEARDRKPDTA